VLRRQRAAWAVQRYLPNPASRDLARPGRNVTGFATIELSVVGEMLQTLKAIAPNVAHVSMI
jgi:hypothetical protein